MPLPPPAVSSPRACSSVERNRPSSSRGGDVAIRAHTDRLPDSTLVQRSLTPAPWFLFAGSAYLDANETPHTPQDLRSHPSLFMMRTGLAPVWRLRHSSKAKEVVIPTYAPALE